MRIRARLGSEAKKPTGKAALVTGGSYGVGAATALALAHDGFDVVVTATRESNLATTLAAIRETGRKADLAASSSICVRRIEHRERRPLPAIAALRPGRCSGQQCRGQLAQQGDRTVTRDEFERRDLLTNVTGTFFPDAAVRPLSGWLSTCPGPRSSPSPRRMHWSAPPSAPPTASARRRLCR